MKLPLDSWLKRARVWGMSEPHRKDHAVRELLKRFKEFNRLFKEYMIAQAAIDAAVAALNTAVTNAAAAK